MSRIKKKNIGVYAYLDSRGLLEKGTGKEIELAKKEYWRDYRKKYNKNKRQENRSFQILFNFKEAKIIARQAKKYHCSAPGYIKQSALSEKQNIVDWVTVGEIRELIIGHHTTLINLIEENELPQPIGNKLLFQASLLEKRILDFFSSLK